MAIRTFADETTRDIYHGVNSKAARQIPQRVWNAARRKMQALNAAKTLSDLSAPGFNLESLKYTLPGWFSIRVNDQYRILFQFAYDAEPSTNATTDKKSGNAYAVQIGDYHGRR